MHTISQPGDPLMAAVTTTPAALLALSDERDHWQARVQAAERAGFDRGFTAGVDAGRRQQNQEDATAHRLTADHIARFASSPGFRALQIRRWAPPGWHGVIPPGLDSSQERAWLAALPRRRDRRTR